MSACDTLSPFLDTGNCTSRTQPLYNYSPAGTASHHLKEWGLGETLLLDFELLLNFFDLHVQRHGEEVEKRMHEHEESWGEKPEP